MYVKKELVEKRKAFHLKKESEISKALQRKETSEISYLVTDFEKLLNELFVNQKADAVRIYIAAYPTDESKPNVPTGKGGTLTLIFRPCLLDAGLYKDITGLNFIINENKPYNSILDIIADEWIKQYNDTIKPICELFNKNNGSTDTRETVSIFYSKSDLVDFMDELKCQKAYEVRASFSSYRSNDQIKKEYFNRLFVEFNMYDIVGKIIWPEKSEQFKLIETKSAKESLYSIVYNNGDLCPPDKCNN